MVPLDRLDANPRQPRRRFDDDGTRGARPVDPGDGDPPADPRDARRRPLPDPRGRAARPGRPPRRTDRGPRPRPRGTRGPRPPPLRARREPPAPRPDGARGGGRLPAPPRGLRADAGRDRRARRQGPGDGRERPPAPEAPGWRSGPRSRTERSRPGTPGRSSRSRPRPTRRSSRGNSSGAASPSGRPRRGSPRSPRAARRGRRKERRVDADTRDAELRLQRALGTKVEIHRRRRGGEVRLFFYSEEELIGLFERLTEEGR